MSAQFPWQDPLIIRHTQRLLKSFHHWTGHVLLTPDASPLVTAQALFDAPFVVVSHGTEADPIFNYGNHTALGLWQLDWDTFTQMPSRKTVATDEVASREQLLASARQNGYISNYAGVRTASSGQRFWIENVVLWDVLDETDQCCGQAATFDRWQFID
jgi:MEKHLA domain